MKKNTFHLYVYTYFYNLKNIMRALTIPSLPLTAACKHSYLECELCFTGVSCLEQKLSQHAQSSGAIGIPHATKSSKVNNVNCGWLGSVEHTYRKHNFTWISISQFFFLQPFPYSLNSILLLNKKILQLIPTSLSLI